MKPVVLIVEDDFIIAESIKADLEANGYDVGNICPSGEAALQAIEKELPDLVLMDIKLHGELDGVQVTDRILKKYRVPVIYLTDVTDQKIFQQAKQTRPSSYLTKPFQTNQLLMNVELALFNEVSTVAGAPYGFFKENDQAKKVAFQDILYIKSGRSYCEVFVRKDQEIEKITQAQPLKAVLKKIPYPDIVRVSRSYAVNKNHVDSIMGQMIFVGDEKIKIGETYDDVLREHFNVI